MSNMHKKLSQTKYARKMRTMRRNETPEEKAIRLKKRREAYQKWQEFYVHANKLHRRKSHA